MEGAEKLVLLIGMEAEQAMLALVQLDLGCFDGSGHAPLLCNHGGNFSMHVMVALKLSCNSLVFLGPGIIVHGGVRGVVGETFEKPVGEFPFFLDGDVLQGEKLVPVDGFIDADGTQAVQSIQFDVWGEYMHGVVTVGDRDEEVKDVPFIFFISFWSPTLLLPVSIPPVCVLLPVLVGCFQVSPMRFMLCQILSSLLEYLKLLLVVMADFLILSHNSCQSLHNEEEFLSSGGPVSFESGTH